MGCYKKKEGKGTYHLAITWMLAELPLPGSNLSLDFLLLLGFLPLARLLLRHRWF